MRSLYIYQALLVLQCPWSINAHPFHLHQKRQDGASQGQPPTIPAATFEALAPATAPASLVADNLVVAQVPAARATVPLETAQMAVTLPSVVATPPAPATIPIAASEPVRQTEQAAAWPITELQTTPQQVYTTVQAGQPVQEPILSTAAVQAPVWAVLSEVSSRIETFSQAVLDSSVPASTAPAPAVPQASVVPAELSDSGFVLLTQDSLATPTQTASLTPQVLAQESLSAGAPASQGSLSIQMAATTTRFATRPTDGVPTLDAQPLLNMPTVSQTDAATAIFTSAAVSEVLESGSSASIAAAVTTVILAATPDSTAQSETTTSSSVLVERVVTVQPSATVPLASQVSDAVPLTPEPVLSLPTLETNGITATASSQTPDPEMTSTHTKRSSISGPEPSDHASTLLNSMPQVPAIVTDNLPRTTHNHKHASTDAMHDTHQLAPKTESAHPHASTKPVQDSKSHETTHPQHPSTRPIHDSKQHEPAKTSALLSNLDTSHLQVGSKSTTPPGPLETTQGVKSLISSLAENPVLPSKLVSSKIPAESVVPVVKESAPETNKSAVPVVVSHLGGFGSTLPHESGQVKPSTATLHNKAGPSDKPGGLAPGASDHVAPVYSGHSVPAVLPGHTVTVKPAPLPAKTNTPKSSDAEPVIVPMLPSVPATKTSPETHGPASTHGPGTKSAPSKPIIEAPMPESSTGPGKGVILTLPVPNKPATDIKPQHSTPPKAATSAPPKSVVKPAPQPETQPVVPTSPSPANKTKDATQAPPAAMSSTPPKTVVPVSHNPDHATQTHTKSPPPASHVMTVPHAKASTESQNTEPSHWLPQTLVRAPTPVEPPVTSQAGPVRTGTTNRQKTAPAPAPAPVSDNLPQAVLPATTLGNTEGMTLGQVTFKDSIPWTFVASTAITQAQLTNFLPSLINQAVSNANAHVRMLAAGAIVVGELSARTVADVWVDAKVAAEVAAAIADGNSAFYNSADMSLLSLSQQVDASFPFLPSKTGKKPGYGSTDNPPPLKVKSKNADNGYSRDVGLADTSGSATQTSEETPSSKPKKAVVLGVAALVSAVSYLGIMFIIMRQVRLRRARRIQLAANSSSGPSRSHLSSLSMPRFGNRNMRGITISAPIRSENSLGI